MHLFEPPHVTNLACHAPPHRDRPTVYWERGGHEINADKLVAGCRAEQVDHETWGRDPFLPEFAAVGPRNLWASGGGAPSETQQSERPTGERAGCIGRRSEVLDDAWMAVMSSHRME